MDWNTIGEYSLGFAGGVGIVVVVGAIIAAIVYAIYISRNYGEDGLLEIIMGVVMLILVLVFVFSVDMDVFWEKVHSVDEWYQNIASE